MPKIHSAHFVMLFVLCFLVQTVSAALLPCLHSGQEQASSPVCCPYHVVTVDVELTLADVSMKDCPRCVLDKVFSSMAFSELTRMTSMVSVLFAVPPQFFSYYQNFQPELPQRPPLVLLS